MRADKKGIPAMFEDVLRKINTKPKQLDDIDEWLFVVINTMKAIIDNSCTEPKEVNNGLFFSFGYI